MKFENLRVAQKLWLVILGLLGLMLVVSIWGQIRSRAVTDQTAQLVAHYEAGITNAVRWRGLSELATSMTMNRAKVQDPALRAEFEASSYEISNRITPVQEAVNKAATSARDKAALVEVSRTRTQVIENRNQMKKFEQSGDQPGLLVFIDKEYTPAKNAYLVAIDKYITEQESQRRNTRS